MLKQLYILRKPATLTGTGDFEYEQVNGIVRHTTLPSMVCPQCQEILQAGGYHPLHLPADCIPLLNNKPMTFDEFEGLKKAISQSIFKKEIVIVPGNSYLPFFWDVSTEPSLDFYWPYGARFILSENARSILDNNHIRGLEYYELSYRFPEDQRTYAVYFEAIIKWAYVLKRVYACAKCDELMERNPYIVFLDALPDDLDIWFSSDVKNAVISERFHEIIHHYGLKNVETLPDTRSNEALMSERLKYHKRMFVAASEWQ